MERRVPSFPSRRWLAAGRLAELLSNWGIPPKAIYPLKHVADSFSSPSRPAQPILGKVETLKTAIIIGQCASGRWHPWETVEFPTEVVLTRLGINSVQKLIEDVKQDLAEVESKTESVAQPTDDVRFPKITYQWIEDQPGRYHDLAANGRGILVRLVIAENLAAEVIQD